MCSENKWIIEELESTREAIELAIAKFLHFQAIGDLHQCKLLEKSVMQAHAYLVRNFGVESSAGIDKLLERLKNEGKPLAFLNSGV